MQPTTTAPLSPDTTSADELRRALAYYQQRVDELGGANVQADAVISAVKSDLRVKNDGFDLLADLQESIDAQMPINEMVAKTLVGINLRLRMDRSVLLARAPDGPGYVPRYGLGFEADLLDRFPTLPFDFAPVLASKESYLLVNKATASTPFIEQLRTQLGLPYFVALPVLMGREMTGVLLAGRYKEIKPFAPPISPSGVNIMRAVAGFVSVAWTNANQFILLEQQVQQRTSELQHSLSELRRTQAQLIQQEKMASLGELTAGVAHELQNPLNFVTNFAELSTELATELQAAQAAGDTAEVTALVTDLTQNLAKISQHGHRAAGIVRSMLMHSHQRTGERRPTDLNALVEEALRLAYHGLQTKYAGFAAKTEADLAPTLPQLVVVPQDISRVLLNLLTNAFYAVRERQQRGEPGYVPTVRVNTHVVGNEVVVQVHDNGLGIPEDLKTKIFQPFFTTKPTGEGTGLGLSLSYDIVTQGHGGLLALENTPGPGATFRILLPSSLASH
jgi:signal transduction histidine kinase